MNRLRTSAAILAVPLLVGCSLVGAGTPGTAETASAGQQEDRETRARVNNESWYNVRVYAADGSRRVSLGSVGSFETATFVVPSGMVAAADRIQLLADPVGSTTTFRSSPVLVRPGDVVEWTVHNDPGQTYNAIRVM
mgnify:CR=1 FL=1